MTVPPHSLAADTGLLELTREEAEELRRAHEADRFHDECGVFGIQSHDEAAHIVYLGLYALQHRGQESCGIVASNGREHTAHRAMGLVADTFNEKILARIDGRHAIGHVRYSTAGESHLRNAQPIYAKTDGGPVSIAHNGNLVNAAAIRRELEGRGAIFSSSNDSEVILHLLARSREGALEDRLIDALSRVKGAFSIVMLTDEGLIAARDPNGFRPLSLGRLGSSWVVASETCALDLIGASFERDIEPGRGRGDPARPHPQPAALRARQPRDLLHLRAHLLRAARLEPESPQRVRLPQGARASARAGEARDGRHGGSGARLGNARGARLRRGVRHPPTRRRSSATTTCSAPSSSPRSRSATSA